MRPLVVILLLLAALGLLAGSGRRWSLLAEVIRAARQDAKHTIEVGGTERSYLLHVPAALPTGRGVPLVLIFHGGGGHAWNMPGFTHFDDLADREGFIAAYPDSIGGNWNDDREISTTDDVAFVRAVIEDIERDHAIDPRRIYATGISNGGFFSNKLACDLGDRIAAIASVAATMPEKLLARCKPSRPMSVLYMHGTNDPLVPIEGGKVGLRHGRSRGQCVSLTDAARFWRTEDQIGAAGDPDADDLPDHVDDGTHVHRETWGGGRDGTEVVVYTIEGGGHAWPGGAQYLPKFIVDVASQNLDATRTIWDFLRTHSLP